MVILSDCIDCKNFYEKNKTELTCKAFPDGIPKEIFWSKCKSNREKPCQNGIKFEPLNEHI